MSADHTTNWSDLAIGPDERLTGKKAQIAYEFEDMRIKILSETGPKAEHAEWVLIGIMKNATTDRGQSPN